MRPPIEQFRDMCLGPVECGECDLCAWKQWRRRIASGEIQTERGRMARQALRDAHCATAGSRLDRPYWISLQGDPAGMLLRSFDEEYFLTATLVPFFQLDRETVQNFVFCEIVPFDERLKSMARVLEDWLEMTERRSGQ